MGSLAMAGSASGSLADHQGRESPQLQPSRQLQQSPELELTGVTAGAHPAATRFESTNSGALQHALREGDTVRYRSSRNWPKPAPGSTAKCDVEIRIGAPIEVAPDSLTAFLTARWALGSSFFSRLLWAQIDHPTWPLHEAELLRCDETLLAPAGLPAPLSQPTALWSPGVEVRIARPGLASRVG